MAFDSSVPFASALDPWLDTGPRLPPAAADIVSPRAREGLELAARRRFASAAGRAMLTLFTSGRLDRRDAAGERSSGAGRSRYDAFCAAMAAPSGRRELASTFPVLDDLLGTLATQWSVVRDELVERLVMDRTALADLAGVADHSFRIAEIHGPLGDPHCHGRSVFRLDVEGGSSIAYKPRPMAGEAHVYGLIDSVVGSDASPTVLDRGSYGWMEWVRAEPVRDAHRFWSRVGATAMVLSLAGVNDLHMGNVIVRGDGIVPLDLECMGKPDSSAGPEAWQPITESVLATGLFPYWFAQGGPIAREASGLFGRAVQTDGRWYPRWRRLGSDAIGLDRVLGRGVDGDGSNVARNEDGVALVPDIDAIERGLGAAAEDLAKIGNELIAAWPETADRFLLRSTGVYAGRFVDLTDPETLRDRDAFRQVAEDLPPFGARWKDELIAGHESVVRTAETKALARLDIPLHRVRGHDLVLDDGVVLTDVFAASGAQCRARRLRRLEPVGLRLQRTLVRTHVEQLDRRLVQPQPMQFDSRASQIVAGAACPSGVDAARALAVQLLGEAQGDPARPGWLELSISGSVATGSLSDTGMYEGSDGIACFFAALARLTGEDEFAASALRALWAPAPDPETSSQGWPGGRAGWVHARLQVAALVDDAGPVGPAMAELGRLLEQPVDPTGRLDLVGGTAGVLAVATAALRAGHPAWTTRTLAFAHELAGAVHSQLDDPVTARHITGLGVAHGARGIIGALRRADATLGVDAARSAADRLAEIDAERRCRRGHVGATLMSTSSGKRARHGWCAGASGYLMALVDADEAGPGDVVIDATIAELERSAPEDRVGLCCGLAGVLVALADIERLDPTGRARALRERTRATLVAAVGEGRPVTFVPGCSMHGSGLFMGRAGLGWALCRDADPDAIPNLLVVS